MRNKEKADKVDKVRVIQVLFAGMSNNNKVSHFKDSPYTLDFFHFYPFLDTIFVF